MCCDSSRWLLQPQAVDQVCERGQPAPGDPRGDRLHRQAAAVRALGLLGLLVAKPCGHSCCASPAAMLCCVGPANARLITSAACCSCRERADAANGALLGLSGCSARRSGLFGSCLTVLARRCACKCAQAVTARLALSAHQRASWLNHCRYDHQERLTPKEAMVHPYLAPVGAAACSSCTALGCPRPASVELGLGAAMPAGPPLRSSPAPVKLQRPC